MWWLTGQNRVTPPVGMSRAMCSSMPSATPRMTSRARGERTANEMASTTSTANSVCPAVVESAYTHIPPKGAPFSSTILAVNPNGG